MDTDQKTESLSRLCEDMESRNVRLPEFQRDFVWDIQKTYDLFDSFVKNIFVGSLIYGIPDFDITVRDIDDRPRIGPGSRKKLRVEPLDKDEIDRRVKTQGFRLLLDGQQRATSVFRAFTGVDKVYMIMKKDEELAEDVRTLKPSKRSLNQVLLEFGGDVPQGRIGVGLHHVYQKLQGDIGREAELVEPFKQSARISFDGDDDEIRKSDAFDNYNTQVSNLEKLLLQEKLVAYYLLNTSQDNFALFFERSNSKGIQLSFIDILAAKLYKVFNLREHFSTFEANCPKGMKVNREVVVRCISFLVSHGKDTGRSFILGKLTAADFDKHWEPVTTCYVRCYEYLLQSHLIVSYAWLPYENMLIPMIMFLLAIPKQQFSYITEPQGNRLHLWFWMATITRRYSSAAQTYVLEDAQALEALARGEFAPFTALLRKFGPTINSVDDLLNVNKKLDAVYQGILNLINYESDGLTSWESGKSVGPADDLDDHHIFPKDYLRKEYKNSDEDIEMTMDCVLNRCLIPKFTNIKVSNKAPKVYLEELYKRNPKLEDALAKHLVPKDIVAGVYDNDFYSEFLKDRGKLVWAALEKHVFSERDKLLKPST